MIAIPSGASGTGISQRWIRNRSPGNHSKMTRAPISVGGMSLKVATILHSPTNGLRASSESPLLVLAVIAFLLLHAVHYYDPPSAVMGVRHLAVSPVRRVRLRITSTAATRPVGIAAAGPAQRHQTNSLRRRARAGITR